MNKLYIILGILIFIFLINPILSFLLMLKMIFGNIGIVILVSIIIYIGYSFFIKKRF